MYSLTSNTTDFQNNAEKWNDGDCQSHHPTEDMDRVLMNIQ